MDINKLRTGDSFLERTKFNKKRPGAYLSAAIRWFARIKFNHIGTIIVEDDKVKVVEAVKEGVVETRIEKKLVDVNIEKYKILRRIDIDEINEQEFIANAKATIGLPYDKPALLFHQPIYQLTLRAKFGIWIGRTKKKAAGMFYCYELAAFLNNKFNDMFPKWWKINPREYINHPLHYEPEL